MAAAIDVFAPQVSHEGRALLRHANLWLRHARLEQVIRAMRACGVQTDLPGFERELDAVREELRRLGQWQPARSRGGDADLDARRHPVDPIGHAEPATGDVQRAGHPEA